MNQEAAMHKYQTYARSRTLGRDARPSPARRRDGSGLAAARQVAAHFVASRWPALAGVDPEVTLQPVGQRPYPELIARLGLAESELGQRPAAPTYTFIFTSQCGTADGALAPIVAAVTVDSQQRIVKTSLSK
jgi:hypothetical protein